MDNRHAYWLAALIDGEGSIYLRTRPGRSRPVVCVAIAQNDRRLLDRAQEYVGCGHIYGNIGPRRNGHQLQINRRDDVLRILKVVAPLLVLKADKARDAIAALESISA